MFRESAPPGEKLKYERLHGWLARTYQSMVGMRRPMSTRGVKSPYSMPFMVVPKGRKHLAGAIFQRGAQRYMELLDNPVDFLVGLFTGREPSVVAADRVKGRGIEKLPGPARALFNRFKNLSNQFGARGDYTGSGFDIIRRHLFGQFKGGKYKAGGAMIMAGLYGGYKLTDSFLRNTDMLQGTILGGGIGGALGSLYQKGSLAYSHISEATGLTRLREWQEEKFGAWTTKVGALGGIAGSFWLTGRLAAGLTGTAKSAIHGRGLGHEWFRETIDGATTAVPFKLRRLIGRLGKTPGIGRAFRPSTRGGLWGAIGLLAAAPLLPFVPGALAADKRPEELEAIYSGEQDVAVRKGRWWEAGRAPYEGGRIMYHRPHMSRLLQTGAQEQAIWGDEYAFRPIKRAIKSVTDPYFYEKMHQEKGDRVYPVWGPSDDGSMILGAIKRIIKPPVYNPMLTGPVGGQAAVQTTRAEDIAYSELGGLPKQKGISPYGLEAQTGRFIYENLTERPGLPGYVASNIKERITGSADWFDQKPVLETSARGHGMNRRFWDMELGGLAGTCMPGDEPILTPDGLKPVIQVQQGDTVYDHQFSPQKVISAQSRECQDGESLYTIIVQADKTPIRVTGNHPLAIYRRGECTDSHKRPCIPNTKRACYCLSPGGCSKRGNKIEWEWTPADQVDIGDFVVVPLPQEKPIPLIDLAAYARRAYTDNYIYARGTRDFALAYEYLEEKPTATRAELRGVAQDRYAKEALRQQKKGVVTQRYPRFIQMDNDWAWWLGWFIAEGCAHPETGQILFSVHREEKHIIEQLGCIYKQKTGGREYSISQGSSENGIVLHLHNVELAGWLQQFGRGAHNKQLNWLVSLPREQLAYLIEGVIAGDGWVNEEKHAGGFTSVSGKLVRDVWLALARLGVLSGITVDYVEKPDPNSCYPQGGRRKDTTRSYLTFAANQLKMYKRRVIKKETVTLEEKKNVLTSNGRCFVYNNQLFIQVSDIIQEGCEGLTVFDIEVENSHCFIGNYALYHNSEGVRRILPKRRFQIDYVNPIRNQFYGSDWLPGPGDKGVNVQHGDPFSSLPGGDYRLPGAGFEALHPELKGLSPDDYPDIWKMKIAADVAPYADKTKALMARVRKQKLAGDLSEREERIYNQTMDQIQARKKRKRFTEYDSPGILGTLADKAHRAALMNPFEFLTPLSPAHKFAGPGSAIDEYEKSLYVPEYAPWAQPVKSYIIPFARMAGRGLGFKWVPGEKEKAREINEYFDYLKYVKHKRLSNVASAVGDKEASKQFWGNAGRTLIAGGQMSGVRHLFRGLAADDRDYFAEFVKETDADKREKIIDLAPRNMKRIYSALWKQSDLQQAVRAEEDEDKRGRLQAELDEVTATAGFKFDKGNFRDFMRERDASGPRPYSYADFMRRRTMERFFGKDGGHRLPKQSALLWSPMVDLDDVKLIVAKNEGLDIHDVGLWESRERELTRKPYAYAAADAVGDFDKGEQNAAQVRWQLKNMLEARGLAEVEVYAEHDAGWRGGVEVEVQHDPIPRMTNQMRRAGHF